MRIAIGQFDELTDENLKFARQLGVSGIQLNTPKLPGDKQWEYEDLVGLRRRCEDAGLRLEALENVPLHFYDKVMLGLPGRDEQIDCYQTTIRNMGQAGIHVLGYHFMPNDVWRTSIESGRGDAQVLAFDLAALEAGATQLSNAQLRAAQQGEPLLSEAEMWVNYAYFIQAMLPVAEEAGVTLALHPDDPPVPVLGGIPRLFRSVESFRNAMEIAGGSHAWGIDLCCGTFSEMSGGAENVRQAIQQFGPQGKIAYVHFRDVQGSVPKFKECFIGEGNYDPAQVLMWLHGVGFDGFLLDDHVPQIVNDSAWGHRARAHAIGYMQALIHVVSKSN